MIIDCVSDLHGHYPQLEGGDLLIVAGDLTATDSLPEHLTFLRWLSVQEYKKIVFIAGNHDVSLGIFDRTKLIYEHPDFPIVRNALEIQYLYDSGTEFVYEEEMPIPKGTNCLDTIFYEKKKLKIWGSPWTKRFPGMNPKCMAFTIDTEEELAEKWEMIPDDTDILITHSPPYGARDRAKRNNSFGFDCVGSKSLQMRSLTFDLKLWVVGHIHEDYGTELPGGFIGGEHCKLINASHVNERYEPVNKPIRVEL